MEELKAQYEQTCKEVLVLKESVVKLRREAVIAREFRDENMRLEDEIARYGAFCILPQEPVRLELFFFF